jgi:hypothetical protein
VAGVPYRLGLRRRRGSLLRNYLLVLGAGLVLQGAASLLVEAVHGDAHGASRLFSDPRHATIHLVWGAVAVQMTGVSERTLSWFGVAFGVFYIGLLVLGLAVHHPFGLMLDRDENVFHAVIGPLTLILALQSLFATGVRRPTHLRPR